jgi:hypothetical protein
MHQAMVTNPRVANLALFGSSIGAAVCGVGAAVLVLLEDRNAINTVDADAWRPPLLLWSGSLLMIAWILSHKLRKARVAASWMIRKSSIAPIVAPLIPTILLSLSAALPACLPTLNAMFEPKWPANVGGDYYTATVGVAINAFPKNKILSHFLFRPEVRYDRSDPGIFSNGDRDQFTVSVDPLFTF